MPTDLTPLGTILLFFLGWLGVWSIVAVPLSQQVGWRPFQPTSVEQKLRLLLPLYAIAPIAILIANQLLGQGWGDQGLRWTLATAIDLLIGWGIAIAGLGLLLLLKTRLGLVTWSAADPTAPNSLNQQFLAGVGLIFLGLVIGGIEELIFRGWLQTQLESVWVPWAAAIAASLLFAVAHLVWDGRAGLWQQPGLWLLGLVLVVARWADGGSIALAWGLHAGWVSGLAYIGEFLQPLPVVDKPTWLTGRTAQPLTDVLDLSLLIITAVVVWQCSGFLASS